MLEHWEIHVKAKQSTSSESLPFFSLFSSLPIIFWFANGALMLNDADILPFDLLS